MKPYYIVREADLRRNLDLITDVARRSGAQIIMAFKANALWRTFPVVREYGVSCTASSLNELRLGLRELRAPEVHSYSPAYTDDNIDEFAQGSTHLTFNSLSQLERFAPRVKGRASIGLRVNPQCSVIDTDIYNPALPGSRFGVTPEQIGPQLPHCVEGLHFHALCESSAADLARVLEAFEERFGRYLPSLKWVNMGGGHLMTREGYDTDRLVEILRGFRSRHPHLKVILEPGSAWMWRTGDLVASVVDIVENQGVKTAILDVSFACHMPDCLEMPYKPTVSESLEATAPGADLSPYPSYRLGGNSCLSGDFMGDWHFPTPLQIGDRLTFEDMNHYTTVKTTMFNGIDHPSILFQPLQGPTETLRTFTYDDYRSRMS